MKSKNSDISSSILSNGKCFTESAVIANTFNDFFHSVTPAIQSKLSFLTNHLKIIFFQRTLTLSP